MLRNYIFVSLLFLLVSAPAGAWDYNFSYTSTDRSDTDSYSHTGGKNSIYTHDAEECGVTSHSYSCRYCKSQYTGKYLVTRRATREKYGAKPKGHSCFKYSCYYQAFSFVKDAPMPIQPLTYNLDVIKTAIKGNGYSYSTDDPRSGITSEKLNAKINVGGYPWGNTYPEWVRPYLIDVGAGTSAMQGLLWSWRSISNNWEGVWTEKSDYEEDNNVAGVRRELPSSLNSKHIILISDGQDTDGIGNYDFTNEVQREYDQPLWTPMRNLDVTGDLNKRGFYKHEGDYGFIFGEALFNGSANDRYGKIGRIYDIEVPFDTCDAHVPEDSIPLAEGKGISEDFGDRIDQEGYEEVCETIKDQGIRVHSVLYGYAENDRLSKCSEITGGLIMKDVEPEDLEDALDDIFISIVQEKIRLTQ